MTAATATKPTTPFGRRSKRDASRWKEQLREACLRRALQSRHQKQQLQQPPSTSPQKQQQRQQYSHHEPLENMENISTPRSFLEEELRHLGVNVASPLQADPATIVVTPIEDAVMTETPGVRDNEHECPYSMTEDEFIELLEEIENDLEQKLLEEQLEMEDGILQDQISSFESEYLNEDISMSQAMPQHCPEIICPLCDYGTLQSDVRANGSSEIYCSRTVRASRPCTFRLQAGVTTMLSLRERMDVSRTTHSDYCHSVLVYSNPDPSTLTASCEHCDTLMRLYG